MGYDIINNNFYPVQLNSIDLKIMYELYIVRNVTFKPSDENDWHTLVKYGNKNPLIVNYQLPRNLSSSTSSIENIPVQYFSNNSILKPYKISSNDNKNKKKSIDIAPRDTTKIDLFVNDIIFNSENHLDVLVTHC